MVHIEEAVVEKVVLITGGTSGIGLALAEAFLAEGASVVVCGRSQTALDRFGQAHLQALAVRADVTAPEARAALLEAVTARFGRLDVLVNNAGTFVERDFAADDATAALDEEVELNLTAPIHLTGEVLRRWPSLDAVVFVTSGFALVSPTRAPTYGAVKAGLHGFADGLRRQLAPRGTHVLEVLPPTTDTPMNAGLDRPMLSAAEVATVTLDALRRRRPMALPGQTRLLPTMLRLAPRALGRRVAAL
nr:SDR family NAD(P)-dependent oxidoreductase [Modestobacter muralis]